MSHDVFISHSSIDVTIANAVCAALEQAKIKCWMAPRDIRPGDSWGGSIIEAIQGSEIMVIIFSANSNSSKQVTREVERAVQKDVVVVPFRIESVDPSSDMEYFLSSTHWLDAVGPETEKHLNELCEIVNSILKRTPEKSSPPEPDPKNETEPVSVPEAEPQPEAATPPKPVSVTPAAEAPQTIVGGIVEPAAAQKKPASGLIIGVLVVLLIAGAVAWFFTQQGSDTEPVSLVDQGNKEKVSEPETQVDPEPDIKPESEQISDTTANAETETEARSEPVVELDTENTEPVTQESQPGSEEIINEQQEEETVVAEEVEEKVADQVVVAELENTLKTCDEHVAKKQLTTGDQGNAIDCYNGVLQLDPENARALAGLRSVKVAVGFLESTLKTCAGHLAQNRLTTGERGNAIDCYNGVLKLDLKNARALTGLRTVRVTVASLSNTLKSCEKHVAENRLTAGIQGNAIDCYNRVLKLDTENTLALAGLRSVQFSIASLKNTLKTCDEHVAENRLKTGDQGNAFDCYNGVLKLDTKNKRALTGLRSIQFAVASLDKNLKTCDEHIAENRLTAGKQGNAIDCYNEVLQLDAENTRAQAGLRSIQVAVVSLENTLQTCDEHVAENRLTTGDQGNAIDCYNSVLQLDIENTRALAGLRSIEDRYLNLINDAIDQSQQSRAMRLLERLKIVNPTHESITELEHQISVIPAQGSTSGIAGNEQGSAEDKTPKGAGNTNVIVPEIETEYWATQSLLRRTKGLSRFARAYNIEKSSSGSDEEALRLYKKVAKQGYDKAQYRLGWMLENGDGTEPDPGLALAWYRQAAAQGNEKARSAANRLERYLGLAD